MNKHMERIETLTNDAVHEVFRGMLSLEMTNETANGLNNESFEQIAGSVGFVGDATGVIYLYAGMDFARVMTQRMLGLSPNEVEDDMVNDAVGELSNMVVGYVKSRLCDGGLPCTLTIPSIVRGRQLTVESSVEISRKVIGFQNKGHRLVAEILVKQPSN
jgi:chemotaxis protein CheX